MVFVKNVSGPASMTRHTFFCVCGKKPNMTRLLRGIVLFILPLWNEKNERTIECCCWSYV